MDRDPLGRADSFPYRTRLAEVMGSPPIAVPAETRLVEAAHRMRAHGISSLLITDPDGRPSGILTEHDLLSAIVEGGAVTLDGPVSAFMSSPVEWLPPTAYAYAAIARMSRLGIRHLAVLDPLTHQAVGVVSARALLRRRVGDAPLLGDEIAIARDGAAMAEVWARLPVLAMGLLRDKAGALQIAGLISAVLRDMSARAAQLAAESLSRDGHGPAPARWCYLVLGSGGRGESLLAADQDNALVHDGRSEDDPWFAELGRRASDILAAAGIPYCQGGVMATNATWRHGLAEWRRQIDGWIAKAEGESLLNIDIFYDFQPVEGDRQLAEALRTYAGTAARSRSFLTLLSRALPEHNAPIGLFGRLRTRKGRLDLKTGGLLPLVSGARIIGLKLGIPATGTAERLQAAAEAGLINADDLIGFGEAHELLMRLVLEQQIADIEAGIRPSAAIEVKRLGGVERRRLREALRQADLISWLVQDALAT